MIEFKTESGARFRIVFEHGMIERKSGPMPQTTAKLYTFREGREPGKQYEFVYSETVTRYYKDKQSKEAGRKAALTHLLRRFGKGFRTLAWQAYFDRKKLYLSLSTQQVAGQGVLKPLKPVGIEV